jgi:uncharacterized membrane protein
MSMSLTTAPVVVKPSRRGTATALALVTIIGLIFIAVAALPYFSLNETQFRTYWPRRWWLLLHIATGIVALMTGPLQLWLGLADRRMEVHRRLGIAYMGAVGVSSITAYYLAFHTDGGFGFGSGLAGLATAWLITTGMAYLAIRRHLTDQHKEWMIRSYVVTTAFVSFRMLHATLQSAGVGTLPEQLAVSAWFCWAVPLVITEALMQGRKILTIPS